MDEVDALVIDEEPNEAFVYPNQDLSKMATSIAERMKKGASPEALRGQFNHPGAPRVISIMAKEWEAGKRLVTGEDIVYGKEHGKYLMLQSGRVNPKAWSLALECRNYQDKFSREILFQERMFVMSRPRVFRKYFRILGLSGSIGSKPERNFLQETYRAAFFEVPPFLKTCKGAPFHDAMPVPMGQLRQPVYVERNVQAQFARAAEVALEAREKVPVLIIAKERGQADQLVDFLQQAARSRGLGRVAEDMVRSLSRRDEVRERAAPARARTLCKRGPLGGKLRRAPCLQARPFGPPLLRAMMSLRRHAAMTAPLARRYPQAAQWHLPRLAWYVAGTLAVDTLGTNSRWQHNPSWSVLYFQQPMALAKSDRTLRHPSTHMIMEIRPFLCVCVQLLNQSPECFSSNR